MGGGKGGANKVWEWECSHTVTHRRLGSGSAHKQWRIEGWAVGGIKGAHRRFGSRSAHTQ